MHYVLNLIVEGEGKTRSAVSAQEGAWLDCVQPLLTNVLLGWVGELGPDQIMDLVISTGYIA